MKPKATYLNAYFRFFFLLGFVFYTISTLKAQNSAIELPNDLKKLVPKGYTVLDTAVGDLNADNLPDVLIALDSVGDTEGGSKRPLLLFLKQKSGSFQLAGRCNDVIFCKNCGGVRGEPYQNLVINRGFFSIEMSGGSRWIWNKIVTFKYSAADKNWLLHRIDNASFDTAKRDKDDKKTYRAAQFGKIRFSEFTYDLPKLIGM